MAASIYLSSPITSLTNSLRLNQACMSFHKRICVPKLYLVRSRVLESIGSVQSSYVNTKLPKPIAASSISAPAEFQRSNTAAGVSGNGMKDFENDLQELFNEVKTMVKMGNKNDAIELLQANYEAVKEQMDGGLRGIEQAAILDIIALGYMAVGDMKFVLSLVDTIREITNHLKDDELLLDSVLLHVASMYSTLGKVETSVLLYQRVIDILEGRHGKNGTLLVTPLLGLARSLGSPGKATKAVEVYHHAIRILETSRGSESADLVVPLLSLGKLLIKEGKATDAEYPFSRILKIYTKLYGERDGRVGMAMCSLAHAKCAKGAADEAVELYRNALRIIKDSNYMAVDDNVLENMRIDLAELLHVVGRGKEGQELLEECLLITEKHKGKDHPSMVTHLMNLATSNSRSKNFVEAERLLRTCLEIMVSKVGPEDQSVTFPMLQLAVTLYQLNRDEEAEKLALDVVSIREKAFGKDSLPVGEALDCLVSIQARLGRDDTNLLEMLERVLKIQEQEMGPESEEIMILLQKIVFYLDKLGKKDEKFKFQRRLSLFREKYKQLIKYQ